MYVIGVLPLKKGIKLDTLTYFSATAYPQGTIVSVPIRTSITMAVVVHCNEVSSAKTALRAATFSLRKLPPQNKPVSIAPGLMTTAEAITATSAYPLGTILFALLPTEIKRGTIPFPQLFPTHNTTPSTTIAPELLLASQADCHISYRSIIRTTLAHGGSLLIVAPTIAHIAPLTDAITSGIEDRIVTFTGGSTKRLTAQYAAYDDCGKAKVIITTPAHAFLDRHDITTIIVDHAHSQHYNARTQPYLDYREALITYAKKTGKKIILADTFLRSDEEAKLREGFYVAYGEHPKRLDLPAKLTYIERPAKELSRQYDIITPTVTETIDKVLSERRNVFLYAPRRGLAPIIICSDCGHIFRCPDSGAPYTLHEVGTGDTGQRWFVSKITGKRVPAADVCPICNSWKLREQGIGIQKVHSAMTDLFPQHKVLLLDSDTTNTERRIKHTLKSFYSTKGAVLVGTSMALPYLAVPVHTSVVTSLDAVRATPTWRSQEDLFGLLLTLREISTEQVLVQGKGPADEVIELAQKGMVEKFYTEELALRQILLYPPYTRFIHLTWRAAEDAGKTFGERIKTQFIDYNCTVYADPHLSGAQRTFFALIRIAESDWPNADLLTRLRALPPSVRIMQNPDRII